MFHQMAADNGKMLSQLQDMSAQMRASFNVSHQMAIENHIMLSQLQDMSRDMHASFYNTSHRMVTENHKRASALTAQIRGPATASSSNTAAKQSIDLPNASNFNTFSDYVLASGFNFKTFLDHKGFPNRNNDTTAYLELLMTYRQSLVLSPPTVMQRPVALESPANCKASNYFVGPRAKPAHMVMILTLSYELDILEGQLYELSDVVDEFVVFEGFYTQFGAHKPQIWPNSKERFALFAHKIKYYHQRPGEIPPNGKRDRKWIYENIRQIAYNRYVEEEAQAGRSIDNTLFVNADIDEFPPATGLLRFKHCETTRLWASFCSVMYEPDFEHIKIKEGKCGRLGAHLWPFPNILRKGETLRDHGFHKNMYDEIAGVHIHARDPWSFIARDLSTADGHGSPEIAKTPDMLLKPVDIWRTRVCKLRKMTSGKQPIVKAENISLEKGALPWFMALNKERFPYLDPGDNLCS